MHSERVEWPVLPPSAQRVTSFGQHSAAATPFSHDICALSRTVLGPPSRVTHSGSPLASATLKYPQTLQNRECKVPHLTPPGGLRLRRDPYTHVFVFVCVCVCVCVRARARVCVCVCVW
jgi:hypothetical protein